MNGKQLGIIAGFVFIGLLLLGNGLVTRHRIDVQTGSDELGETAALYHAGNVEQAEAIVLSDRGLQPGGKLRLVFARMRQEETRLESVRMAAASIWLAMLVALLGLAGLVHHVFSVHALRKKHARELRASEELYRTALTSIGDAVIATDRLGRVTFLNPAAENLTGIGVKDARGKSVSQVFRIFDELTGKRIADPVEKVIELGLVIGMANHHQVLERSGGFRIPIDDSAAPIWNEQHELTGVVLVFCDTSERRRAEAESHLLASIVQSSGDAIIGIDMNGIITSWNRSASAIFGYSAGERIGCHVSSQSPPERKDEMGEVLDRVGRGEQVEHFQSVRCRKDGRSIHVSISVSPIRDANGEIIGVSEIVRDITAQFESEREIAAHREWLRVTLKSIGDAVVTTDAAGAVTYLNPVAEQLTGWSLEDASGRLLTEIMRIVNEESRQPVENPVARVLRAGEVADMANHTVLMARDGRELSIDDSAAPIRDDRGAVIGTVLVFRDVTADRKAEEMLRRTEKLAATARLSATVAHEINNPLAAIVNLVYIAKNTLGTPAAVVQLLVQAEQELDRVVHITRQTLAFYRESGASEPVEITALIESVLKLYANKLAAKNIKVERELKESMLIRGVGGELRQAVSNLIANAIDAVDSNGTITVRGRLIFADGVSMAEIVVADDGPGIASEHIDRVFEPFFTTKKDVGTGLGLWAAKTIIERHGGTIAVRPRQDGDGSRGASFAIQLPCAVANENSGAPGLAA